MAHKSGACGNTVLRFPGSFPTRGAIRSDDRRLIWRAPSALIRKSGSQTLARLTTQLGHLTCSTRTHEPSWRRKRCFESCVRILRHGMRPSARMSGRTSWNLRRSVCTVVSRTRRGPRSVDGHLSEDQRPGSRRTSRRPPSDGRLTSPVTDLALFSYPRSGIGKSPVIHHSTTVVVDDGACRWPFMSDPSSRVASTLNGGGGAACTRSHRVDPSAREEHT